MYILVAVFILLAGLLRILFFRDEYSSSGLFVNRG